MEGATGAGKVIEEDARGHVVIVQRAGIAGLEVGIDGSTSEHLADIGKLAATAGATGHVDPEDVPADLGGAIGLAPHATGVRGGVPLETAAGAKQRQGIADLQVTGAMCGDVAEVGAGTKAVEGVADTTVGAGDAALAIPVDGALVDAGGGRAGPPVRKVH